MMREMQYVFCNRLVVARHRQTSGCGTVRPHSRLWLRESSAFSILKSLTIFSELTNFNSYKPVALVKSVQGNATFAERKATIKGRSWARQSSGAVLCRIPKSVTLAANPLKGGVANISLRKCQPWSGRRLWQSQGYSAFQGRALERAACKKCPPRSERRHQLP